MLPWCERHYSNLLPSPNYFPYPANETNTNRSPLITRWMPTAPSTQTWYPIDSSGNRFTRLHLYQTFAISSFNLQWNLWKIDYKVQAESRHPKTKILHNKMPLLVDPLFPPPPRDNRPCPRLCLIPDELPDSLFHGFSARRRVNVIVGNIGRKIHKSVLVFVNVVEDRIIQNHQNKSWHH